MIRIGRKTIAFYRGEKPNAQGGVKTLCPVCGIRKYPREFRQSNRNPRRNTICWKCRSERTGIESKFYQRSKSVLKANWRRIHGVLTTHFKRRVNRGKEYIWMPDEQAVKVLRFPERVAAIIGKTHIVRGDDYTLDDYEALLRIRDLLDELDAQIIERNRNKKLLTK
jgi:hypothetical protein